MTDPYIPSSTGLSRITGRPSNQMPALDWLDLGFAVHPLVDISSKSPKAWRPEFCLLTLAQRRASVNENPALWKRLGVEPGSLHALRNFIVIDDDSCKDKHAGRERELAQHCLELIAPASTRHLIPQESTPSGGRHYYFRNVDNIDIANKPLGPWDAMVSHNVACDCTEGYEFLVPFPEDLDTVPALSKADYDTIVKILAPIKTGPSKNDPMAIRSQGRNNYATNLCWRSCMAGQRAHKNKDDAKDFAHTLWLEQVKQMSITLGGESPSEWQVDPEGDFARTWEKAVIDFKRQDDIGMMLDNDGMLTAKGRYAKNDPVYTDIPIIDLPISAVWNSTIYAGKPLNGGVAGVQVHMFDGRTFFLADSSTNMNQVQHDLNGVMYKDVPNAQYATVGYKSHQAVKMGLQASISGESYSMPTGIWWRHEFPPAVHPRLPVGPWAFYGSGVIDPKTGELDESTPVTPITGEQVFSQTGQPGHVPWTLGPKSNIPDCSAFLRTAAGFQQPHVAAQACALAALGLIRGWLRGSTIVGRSQPFVSIEGPAGCLTGDTLVTAHRAGRGFQITLADLVYKFNGGGTTKRLQKTKSMFWDLSIPTRIAYSDGQCIRSAELAAAFATGTKECFRVTTVDGRSLSGSAEHPVFVPARGWVPISDLVVGDKVAMRGERTRKPPVKVRDTYATNMALHPYTNQKARSYDRRVVIHRAIYEAELNGLTFAEYVSRCRYGPIDGLQFVNPREFDIHHKNHDHYDNRPENLEPVEHHQHLRTHHRDETSVLFPVIEVAVSSVEPIGPQPTFDLTMRDEPHSYIANGFVVHNSGKSHGIFAAMYGLAGAKTGLRSEAQFSIEMTQSRCAMLVLDDLDLGKEWATLMRLQQAEESWSKTNALRELLGLMVVSSQGFDLIDRDQALLDRVFRINVPDVVKHRKSLLDPEASQADDLHSISTEAARKQQGTFTRLVVKACGMVDVDVAVKAVQTLWAKQPNMAVRQKLIYVSAEISLRIYCWIARGADPAEEWWLPGTDLSVVLDDGSVVDFVDELRNPSSEESHFDAAAQLRRDAAPLIIALQRYLAEPGVGNLNIDTMDERPGEEWFRRKHVFIMKGKIRVKPAALAKWAHNIRDWPEGVRRSLFTSGQFESDLNDRNATGVQKNYWIAYRSLSVEETERFYHDTLGWETVGPHDEDDQLSL